MIRCSRMAFDFDAAVNHRFTSRSTGSPRNLGTKGAGVAFSPRYGVGCRFDRSGGPRKPSKGMER